MEKPLKHNRVLLITSWFPSDVGLRGLMNEFADAVIESGAEIDVIAIEWRDKDRSDDSAEIHKAKGMTVYRYPPFIFSKFGSKFQLLAKWIVTSLRALPITMRLLWRNDYDVIVANAPSPVWAPVLLVNLFSSARTYLIQWDFIPHHQRAIGLIPDGLFFYVLQALENILVRGFDTIGCMSEKNIDFLRRNFWIGQKQKIEILPIWGEATFISPPSRNELRKRYNLPLNKKIAVFGGTLSAGRGIDDILATARLEQTKNSDIVFLIIGNGPLAAEINAAAENLGNVIVKKAIPKQDYVHLLSSCDCAIVATQRNTGMPTFPSKTMDYFRAGVPVIASVEDSTDFGGFLVGKDAGIALEAGSHLDLYSAIDLVTSNRELSDRLTANGRILMQEYFNVNIIVTQVLQK